jgi:ribosomal protein L11 methyltransferase
MSWLQVSFEVDRSRVEALAEALDAAGALAVTLEDAQNEPVYEPLPQSVALWRTTRLRALFDDETAVSEVLSTLGQTLGTAPLTPVEISRLEERDWQREHEAQWSPLVFGNRLWIGAPWHPRPSGQLATVVLSPGLAFGTGSHPTTALCLEWLAECALEGATVVDYGCGSGILAIAAARIGARRVWAVDHDLQALQATRENSAANDLGHRVIAVPPDDLPSVSADFLVANLLARPLLELAPKLLALTRRGGRLALSGILETQTRQVSEAYEPWMSPVQVQSRDGWTLLEGVRQ